MKISTYLLRGLIIRKKPNNSDLDPSAIEKRIIKVKSAAKSVARKQRKKLNDLRISAGWDPRLSAFARENFEASAYPPLTRFQIAGAQLLMVTIIDPAWASPKPLTVELAARIRTLVTERLKSVVEVVMAVGGIDSDFCRMPDGRTYYQHHTHLVVAIAASSKSAGSKKILNAFASIQRTEDVAHPVESKQAYDVAGALKYCSKSFDITAICERPSWIDARDVGSKSRNQKRTSKVSLKPPQRIELYMAREAFSHENMVISYPLGHDSDCIIHAPSPWQRNTMKSLRRQARARDVSQIQLGAPGHKFNQSTLVNHESGHSQLSVEMPFGGSGVRGQPTRPLAAEQTEGERDQSDADCKSATPKSGASTRSPLPSSGLPVRVATQIYDQTTQRTLVELEVFRGGVWEGGRSVPRSELICASTFSKMLSDWGVPNPRMTNRDLDTLLAAPPLKEIEVVSRPGWNGRKFRFPRRTVRTPQGKVGFSLWCPERRGVLAPLYRRRGDVESWRRAMQRHASQSSFLVFAVGAAFAAPLLKFSDQPDGAGFQFTGPSSTGKTLALLMAQSAFARASRGDLFSFNVTDVAVERYSEEMQDLPRLIDDTSRDQAVGQAQKARLDRVAHQTANAGTRWRSRAYEAQHGAAKNRSGGITLTSGEASKREMVKKDGGALMGGAEVRMIDIPVPPVDQQGVFDRLGGPPCTRPRRARRHAFLLERAISQNYGRPFRAYLTSLEKDYPSLRSKVRKLEREATGWLLKDLGDAADSFTARRAGKLALIFAGLMIGIESGVLPFSESLAKKSVLVCWRRVIAVESHSQASMEVMVARLQTALSNSNRTPILVSGQPLPATALAFRRLHNTSMLAYLTEKAIAAFCEIEETAVGSIVAEMDRLGAWAPGHNGKRKKGVEVGGKRGQFFAVKEAFWKAPATV